MKRRRKGKIGRRAPTRQPKIRFTLFCEGRNTEPLYFKVLKSHYNSSLISIHIQKKGRVPITLAEKAQSFVDAAMRKGIRKNLFEEHDQVWVVVDRDKHERFDEAVKLCETNGICVARSNPCFEVWLILHMRDYDRQDESHRVKRTLRDMLSEHDLAGKQIYEQLMTMIEDAEERADILNRQRRKEGQLHGCPSTTVGELTRAIRNSGNRANVT